MLDTRLFLRDKAGMFFSCSKCNWGTEDYFTLCRLVSWLFSGLKFIIYKPLSIIVVSLSQLIVFVHSGWIKQYLAKE